MDLQEAKSSFITFFSFLASIPHHEKNCFDWQKKTHVKDCCCLVEAIRNDDSKDLLATYLASFVLLPGDTQTSQLQQIIQGRTFPDGGTRTYAIPVSGHKSIHLCATSTKNIFELRKEAWSSLRVFTEAHGVTTMMRSVLVGNKNKSKTSAMVLAKDDVVDFLTDIGETEGGPYATQFIRQLTGVGIRNSDSEVIELPSWLTKRKLYGMFMYQQGVIAKADAKGKYTTIKRHDEEWLAISLFDEEHYMERPICAFSTFWKIWQDNCAHIKIQPRCEDTCNECHIIRNEFRYRALNHGQEEDGEIEDSNTEDTILAAAKHVESAQNMRELINSRVADAKGDHAKDNENNFVMSFEERRQVIVIDYAQNMDIPHFGQEHRGNILLLSSQCVLFWSS